MRFAYLSCGRFLTAPEARAPQYARGVSALATYEVAATAMRRAPRLLVRPSSCPTLARLMAIMIPPQEPESGPGKRAERQLLLLLRERLSDDFWVFYDFHFVGGGASKGDGVRVTRDGRWTRETTASSR